MDDFSRSLLDAAEHAYAVVDPDGNLQWLNRAAWVALGWESAGLPIANWVSPDATSAELRTIRGEPITGSISHVQGAAQGWRLVRLRANDSESVCDIQSTVRSVIDAISDGVIVISETGVIQLFNPAAERLFRFSKDEAIGRNVNILMPSPFREHHDQYLQSYRQTGDAKIIGKGRELVGRRKDGSVFPIHLSIGELRDSGRRMFVGIIHDLTHRKESEARLTVLSQAVEQVPAAVMITDRQRRIEYVNEGFCRLTGYSREEAKGQTPRLLAWTTAPEGQAQQLWERIESGGGWQGEVLDYKKSGEPYWALETVAPVLDAEGLAPRFVAMQLDITQQKRDREALQESEIRFRLVAEMVGEWLWEQDGEGRYTFSSRAVKSILGFEPEEIVGHVYTEFLPPEEPLPPGLNASRPFYRLTNRYRHRDGHEVFTESSGAPVYGEDGKVLRWRGMDVDITARKKFEDALRVRDRAIAAANVGICISEVRGQHCVNVYTNPALTRITGYEGHELVGSNLRILQGPETDPVAVEKIRLSLEEGTECEVVIKNYRKDGTPFWNELLLSPVFDETGAVTHYIGVQTDVTERRRAAEERHELEIAKHIQLSLLPKAPLYRNGAGLAGICIPATHVGGDYYDYFNFGEQIDMVIADVSGHSVGAALIMAEMRSTLKAETRKTRARGGSSGPAEMLRALNELLYEDLSGAELFITMFYVRYDPLTGRLRYANAGHNPGIWLVSAAQQCETLDAEGLILGVRRDVVFEEKTLQMAPGDQVLLYTDGVTEACNEAGEFFDLDGLKAALLRHRDAAPEPTIKALAEEVRKFRNGGTLSDDVSMVVLRSG